MNFVNSVKALVGKVLHPKKDINKKYYRHFCRYAFSNGRCENEYQYEAMITKLYHAVEKGLSYLNYRPGFGQKNIESLIGLLDQYSEKYDVSAFFYQTALSTL